MDAASCGAADAKKRVSVVLHGGGDSLRSQSAHPLQVVAEGARQHRPRGLEVVVRQAHRHVEVQGAVVRDDPYPDLHGDLLAGPGEGHRQRGLELAHGLLLKPREQVRVGIQGDADGGMIEAL